MDVKQFPFAQAISFTSKSEMDCQTRGLWSFTYPYVGVLAPLLSKTSQHSAISSSTSTQPFVPFPALT